jgi:RNA polymerase sigma-70 factor (ECF subfamily)
MRGRVELDLVVSAQRGDREAFAALTRPRTGRLFGIARRILRDVDRAEDVVQQTLVTAWRELPRLRDPARFDAWLTRLLIHGCYAEARRTRRLAGVVAALPTGHPAARDAELDVVRRDQIERGFRRLSPDQRALLVLRHYLGYEPTEIARILEIPEGTARSRLHYAHRAMRAALEADARPTMVEGHAS